MPLSYVRYLASLPGYKGELYYLVKLLMTSRQLAAMLHALELHYQAADGAGQQEVREDQQLVQTVALGRVYGGGEEVGVEEEEDEGGVEDVSWLGSVLGDGEEVDVELLLGTGQITRIV
jgi:hypothetical protein